MKYDMLSYKAAERLWDAFQGHNACVNEKCAPEPALGICPGAGVYGSV